MRGARSRSLGFVALALGATATNAHAEGAEEVVVRGRGSDAGGFVSRARIEDSPREITDAASLVEPMPGVHVRRLGGDDAFATLSIRGTSSTQVMVYLAGVPLTGGGDPSLDLATLPLWPSTEARVFRSFAPAALGRGSLGGSLVLDPPSPRARPSTEIWGAVGSYGQARLRLGDVRGDPEGIRVATGFSGSRTDDDFPYFDPLSGRDTQRENAGHAAVNGLATAALPVRFGDGRGAITITTLAQARKQELPGTITNPTRFQSIRSSRLLSAIELTAPGPGSNGAFVLRTWGRREGFALRDSPAEVVLSQLPSKTDDAIVALGASAGYKLSALDVRIDGSAERYAPGTWENGSQPESARRTNGGLAADANLRSGIATFAASARGDVWLDAVESGASEATARPTAHAGAEIALGEVVLAGHGGFVARPASFVERYGNAGGFLPSRGPLAPESATTIDVGAHWTHGRSRRARLEIETAGFATWADDLIVFVATGAYGRARAENIGSAGILGLESALRGTLGDFSLRVSHTALAAENRSSCTGAANECVRPPLPGRPEHDLVLDLAWEHGIVRLRYGVDVVAGMFSDTAGKTEVPDRMLHGASARLAVPHVPGLSLTLDVRNLFDLRTGVANAAFGSGFRVPIGDMFDFPLPGRRFLLSARWVFPELR